MPDWLRMIKVENLKKESVSFGFHGASGTLGQNICFFTSGKQSLDPFWESESNCSGEVLAGAIPRPVGLSAPLEPGTAKQVLPLRGSMEA